MNIHDTEGIVNVCIYFNKTNDPNDDEGKGEAEVGNVVHKWVQQGKHQSSVHPAYSSSSSSFSSSSSSSAYYYYYYYIIILIPTNRVTR